MKMLRLILPVVGVLFGAVFFFIGGLNGVADAWKTPASSTRHQLYEFLLQAHQHETIGVLVVYLVLVLFAFRKECREFWLH